jgi:hypothetical protein
MTAIAKRAGAHLLLVTACLACLATPATQARSLAAGRNAGSTDSEIRFDPSTRETRLTNRVTPGLCFSLALPQEWQPVHEGEDIRMKAVSSDAGLEIGLRSARELQDLPQPDLAQRDAAFLQRDYEGMLGRPAQSVSLTSPVPGATRWSATWVDANLPSASRAMTIETFIVPLSRDWVLELSLTDVPAGAAYDALARSVLSGLVVRVGAACGR